MKKHELLKEYAKCAADPVYFAEKYCKVFDLTSGGYKSFTLFEKQKELISAYGANRFNIVLKPRQAGVSTTTALHCACTLLFADSEKPEKILIIANKRETATEFLKKVKHFISSAPSWMFEGDTALVTNNEGNIELVNGSAAKAVATSEDALRGFTPTIMIMDEAAYIKDGDLVWMAALPALASGGRAILLSTPNGLDSLYYAIYDGAKTGKNNFNIIELKWYEDPRYNKDLKWVKGDEVIKTRDLNKFKELVDNGFIPTSSWYEQMCRDLNGDTRKIAQELSGVFLGSGNNVIEEEHIIREEKTNVKPPIRKEGFDNNVFIWADPIEGHKYILAGDVSRGDSTDYSTIEILDIDTGEQVLEYQGKIAPDKLGELVYFYGNKYSAYSVIDVTGGMGQATIIKLLDLKFEHLHYCAPGNSTYVKNKMTTYSKNNLIPGFIFGNNRAMVINALQVAMRDGEICVRSQRLINEMRTYIFDKNGKPDHMKNFNDDLLIAMAMLLYVLQNHVRDYKRAKAQTEAMLNSITAIDNSTPPTHIVNNPAIIYQNSTITPDLVRQYGWLFK